MKNCTRKRKLKSALPPPRVEPGSGQRRPPPQPPPATFTNAPLVTSPCLEQCLLHRGRRRNERVRGRDPQAPVERPQAVVGLEQQQQLARQAREQRVDVPGVLRGVGPGLGRVGVGRGEAVGEGICTGGGGGRRRRRRRRTRRRRRR